MTNCNSSSSKQSILDLYTDFINSFDGTPTAYANAKPILTHIFDSSSFLFLTDDGPKDLTWYREFAKSFAESGNVATVTSIESTDYGFQVTIKNTVGGVEIDPITYNVTVGDVNGTQKITYFVPSGAFSQDSSVNHNMENVGKMVRLVDECASKGEGESIMFICRMELFDDKVDEFKYYAHQAMKDIEATERDTLSFSILYDDPFSCHTIELYRNSRAAKQHLFNMQKNQYRNCCISECAKVNVLEVHGDVTSSLKMLLDEEDYSVVYRNKQVRRALSYGY
jgi:hypothetical protein